MAQQGFYLDVIAAQSILTEMAAPVVKQAGEAIASRANSLAGKLTTQPISITTDEAVGTIRVGKRYIMTITASGDNPHTGYLGHMALVKSRDAGRIS